MKEIGINRTENKKIKWLKATGIDTTLDNESVDWVTFGSSFNVMDRDLALNETYRILKKDGYFTCMWNHRDLNDPIQQKAEEIILEFIPNYDRGVRRQDQRPKIEEHKDKFDEIFYLEIDFYFYQTIENYIKAWKSIKNKYWDLETKEGKELFEAITNKMREKLPKKFKIKYITRAWTAKKV